MSIDALNWAIGQKIKGIATKCVLLVLANHADDNYLAWPSLASLIDSTSGDRKTVIEAIKRLRELGHLEDTGERKGQTRQVVVYRLNRPVIGTIEQTLIRNDSESGTVPNLDANSTVFPKEQSQISLVTVPKTGHGTIINHKEPSSNPKSTSSSQDIEKIFKHWQTTLNHPRAKLDAHGRRKISEALKNHSVEELIEAIDGCARSDFHMGANDRRKVYDGLGLIFRNAEKIEDFRGIKNPVTRGAGHINGRLTADRFMTDFT